MAGGAAGLCGGGCKGSAGGLPRRLPPPGIPWPGWLLWGRPGRPGRPSIPGFPWSSWNGCWGPCRSSPAGGSTISGCRRNTAPGTGSGCSCRPWWKGWWPPPRTGFLPASRICFYDRGYPHRNKNKRPGASALGLCCSRVRQTFCRFFVTWTAVNGTFLLLVSIFVGKRRRGCSGAPSSQKTEARRCTPGLDGICPWFAVVSAGKPAGAAFLPKGLTGPGWGSSQTWGKESRRGTRFRR